jgi:hypothetical protein
MSLATGLYFYSTGLGTNNAVMIVASMLLSPLMGPILAFSVGAVVRVRCPSLTLSLEGNLLRRFQGPHVLMCSCSGALPYKQCLVFVGQEADVVGTCE